MTSINHAIMYYLVTLRKLIGANVSAFDIEQTILDMFGVRGVVRDSEEGIIFVPAIDEDLATMGDYTFIAGLRKWIYIPSDGTALAELADGASIYDRYYVRRPDCRETDLPLHTYRMWVEPRYRMYYGLVRAHCTCDASGKAIPIFHSSIWEAELRYMELE